MVKTFSFAKSWIENHSLSLILLLSLLIKLPLLRFMDYTNFPWYCSGPHPCNTAFILARFIIIFFCLCSCYLNVTLEV